MTACRKNIFIFTILIHIATAYNTNSHAQHNSDSTYVRNFPGQVTVRTYLGEKISIFNLIDPRHNNRLHYRPNNILGIGFGITVKGIGLDFSTRLPFHDDKAEQYGRTRRYDLQLHRYQDMLALDAYAQRYKGFHLNSNDGIDSVTTNTLYQYFPKLVTLNLGASGMYVFNGHKFSMRAATSQQEWQLKSAGSFMLGAAFFAHYIYNNESILPPYLNYKNFFEDNQIRHISNYGLTLKGGYGYNYIFSKHFFASGTVEAGAGPGYSIVKDELNNKKSAFGLNLTVSVRIAAGYNSEKWFSGFYSIFHSDSYALPFEDSRASSSQGIFRLVVARRITTRHKFLQSKG